MGLIDRFNKYDATRVSHGQAMSIEILATHLGLTSPECNYRMRPA